MLREGYASHWNRAGWKPYMRYSQGGVTDHTSENISSLNSTGFEVSFDSVKAEMTARHEGLIGEEPPYDQHRRNILDPRHTHVGIGRGLQQGGSADDPDLLQEVLESGPHSPKAGALLRHSVKGQGARARIRTPGDFRLLRTPAGRDVPGAVDGYVFLRIAR